jgi:hypothetical protein
MWFMAPLSDALAAQVTLSWDSNGTSVEGYRIFQRLEDQAYDYTQPVWTGVDTVATLDDLAQCTNYFFVVRAYSGGDESSDSNEVSYMTSDTNDSSDSIHFDGDSSTINPVPANDTNPPSEPTILTPLDGDTVAWDNVHIETSAFEDPDDEDQHTHTQIRITTIDDNIGVLNLSLDLRYLQTLRVPRLVLDPGEGYWCQVRYFNDKGLPSQWSEKIEIITDVEAEPLLSSSKITSTGTWDLNTDGVHDDLQPEVIASLETYTGLDQMGISIEDSENVVQLLAAKAYDPSTMEVRAPFDIQDMPYGLLGYKIRVAEPGQTAGIQLLFSDSIDPKMQWYRYNRITGWQVIDRDIEINSNDNGIVRYITDGGPEDGDGEANGIIVELIGPLWATTCDLDRGIGEDQDESQSTSGSSGGGCFLQSLKIY